MSFKLFSFSSFLKANNPLTYGKHDKKYLYKDGKVINGTIYYYPRQIKFD